MKEWQKLPQSYREAFEVASAEANMRMVAAYDAKNPPALARLRQQDAKLPPIPKDFMVAAIRTAHELYDEEAAANQVFRRFYQSRQPFHYAQYQGYRIAEAPFSNFMAGQRLPFK